MIHTCKRITPLILALVFGLLPSMAGTLEGGNPFLKMIGHPYAWYMLDMKTLRYEMDYVLSREQADSLVTYMEEAVAVAGNKQWEFESRFFMISYRFHYEKEFTVEKVIQEYKDICWEATAVNDTIVNLRGLYALMFVYYKFTKEYDLAFDLTKKLVKELESISSDVLPEKLFFLRDAAEMYYRFRDYDDARKFYLKVLASPENAARYNLIQSVYNGLALIARYHENDLATSDRYLHKILAMPPHPMASDTHNQSWEAIGHGNLGYNLYLRKKYREAIPEMEFAWKRMEELNDLSYAGSMATTLADIYLRLNDKNSCKQFIDRVESYNQKIEPHKPHANLYPILCKYYLSINDNKLAQQYLDSVIASQKRSNEEFNPLKLVRAEQRNHKLEQQIKDEELNAEQQRVERYRSVIIFIVAGALLIGGSACSVTVLYIRKRNAYRMLVRKNQTLAHCEPHGRLPEAGTEAPPSDEKNDPSPREEALMQHIRRVMEEQKLYTNPDMDLSALAEVLKVGRTAVSNAINHCAGMTVTQYINECRVNEAIRIMSRPKIRLQTVDAIAERAGFNDRKNFYRIFKKQTGLAPSEFQSNIQEKQ